MAKKKNDNPTFRQFCPQIRSYLDSDLQREYVFNEVLRLIENDDLYLTEWFHQDVMVTQHLGDLILGFDHNRTGDQIRGEIPDEFLRHHVRIESIEHDVQVDLPGPRGTTIASYEWKKMPIAFQKASRPIIERNVPHNKDQAMQYGLRSYADIQKFKEYCEELDEYEADLSMADAWWCLQCCGKYVRTATSERTKRATWKVREVPPWEMKQTEIPVEPKKRRQRKMDQQIDSVSI